MRIGVYVGSFNPPHRGHINVVKYLLDNEFVDKILLIPSLPYWEKIDLIPIKFREKMLKFYENEKISVDISKIRFKYTFEVMNELKIQYPGDKFFLIIGSDNLRNFYKWKNVSEILKNYVIVMMREENDDVDKYIDLYEDKDRFIVVRNFEPIEVSSTVIREKLAKEEYEELKSLVDRNVLDYIVQNNLYRRN